MAPETDAEVLFSGNLATPRRTVLGVFGLLERSDVPPEQARAFLIACGLPPIALEEPDIPITRAQQLACAGRLLGRLDPALSIPHHALEVGLGIHITLFGMLGLSMMYAGSLAECLRVVTTYPELSWGHSRLLVGRRGDTLEQTFVLEGEVPGASPEAREALRRYSVSVDLFASVRMIADLFGGRYWPSEVQLPYPAPRDRHRMERRLRCPVRFDAPQARLVYGAALWDAVPLHANPLVFRTYEKLTAQLARRLRSDVDLAEQVRRLLWMSSPPPDRDAVASMLALSPRTLARKLAAEDTSYATLQAEVQLARAQTHLRARGTPISEIAERLGFSEPAAFTRAFRRWSGETPSAWRARQLADG